MIGVARRLVGWCAWCVRCGLRFVCWLGWVCCLVACLVGWLLLVRICFTDLCSVCCLWLSGVVASSSI